MAYLKTYEYVIAVAKSGGISQAADLLHISQPTLSKYLKKLETDLGIELFDRSTLPIKLTLAGELYAKTGKYMLDIDRQLQKQLEEIKQNKNAVVRVGISPSRSLYMTPEIVQTYRRENPDGRVVIEEKTTAELSHRLASGELDLIISILDEDTDGFEKVDLFEESIVLAVGDMLYRPGDTALDILCRVPLINVGKGQALWQTTLEISRKLHINDPEIECQSIESALALVKKGLGAMLLPSYIAKLGSSEQNKEVRFFDLPTEQHPYLKDLNNRKICLFYRKEQFLTQAEKSFILCVEKLKEKHSN